MRGYQTKHFIPVDGVTLNHWINSITFKQLEIMNIIKQKNGLAMGCVQSVNDIPSFE